MVSAGAVTHVEVGAPGRFVDSVPFQTYDVGQLINAVGKVLLFVSLR